MRHSRRKAHKHRDQLTHQHAAQNPKDAANQRQRSALDQELHQHIALLRAQRLAHADLPRALRHAHQHDVHDHHAADHQRDRAQPQHDPREDAQQLVGNIQKRVVGLISKSSGCPGALCRRARMMTRASSSARAITCGAACWRAHRCPPSRCNRRSAGRW